MKRTWKVPAGFFIGGQTVKKQTPRVLNVTRVFRVNAATAVNCMRPGPFGNRFIAGVHGDRDEVCDLHKRALLNDYGLLAKVERLRGLDLVCCCVPKNCHCNILFVLANTDKDIGDTACRSRP